MFSIMLERFCQCDQPENVIEGLVVNFEGITVNYLLKVTIHYTYHFGHDLVVQEGNPLQCPQFGFRLPRLKLLGCNIQDVFELFQIFDICRLTKFS